MNKVELVGQLANIKEDKLKINSGYLNGVVFTPDYDGNGFANFFPTVINESTTKLDDLVTLITESQKKVDKWHESDLKVKIVAKVRAANYSDRTGKMNYQNVLEINELEVL